MVRWRPTYRLSAGSQHSAPRLRGPRRQRASWLALPGAAFAVLLAQQTAAQQVPPPFPPPPPPTFLHDALGLSDDFTIYGSIRSRIEGLDGQFRPAPAPRSDKLLELQSTLFAEYRTGAFKFGGELFDMRTYLDGRNSTISTSEVNTFEPGQAYVGADLTKLFGLPGAVTAGRFTMDIGSRRLVARHQFRNTFNTFTGLRYDWQNAEKDTLRLFYTMPDYRLPDELDSIRVNDTQLDRPSTDLQFFGGAYLKNGVFGGTMQLQGYGLIEHDSPTVPTANRNLFTPAIRFARESKMNAIDWDFEGMYQTGRARASTNPTDMRDLSVSAYFFHGEVGYTLDAWWLPRFAAFYDHASGNTAGSSTYGRFDTLFGARRGELGPSGLYGPVQRANTISPGVRFDVLPSSKQPWDGFIIYRSLFLESATDSFGTTQIVDPTGQSGRFAGQQIDTRVRYWIVRNLLRLDTGISYLIKGPFLRDAPNVQDKSNTVFGYSAVTLTF